MPDPRLPHKGPQSRQPAPQPHKGLPAERSAPREPEAAGQQAHPRLIRPLAPNQQAPPIEFERKLRKGETYWVMGDERVPKPRKAKVVRLTNEPGKRIGVEFEEPVGGIDKDGKLWGVNHNCDGYGKLGHCLYLGATQVLDDRAMEAHKARMTDQEKTESQYEDYDELTVGPEHSQSAATSSSEREQFSIEAKDVGKMPKDVGKPKDEGKSKDAGKSKDEAPDEDEDE
jgi:hypothetical protein